MDSTSQDQNRLQAIREQIDSLDSKLLELLNQRAGLSLEVGKIKASSNDTIFKPFREKEVMGRLIADSSGLLPENHLRSIYREILSSSRRLQRPQKIVYLGPEGTFSYFAAIEFLGHSVELEPRRDFIEVFESVAQGEAELGVIPLENSLHGAVGQTLDMFLRHDVFIQSELFCRITHSLLSQEQDLAAINTVYSHPQALAQCTNWLRSKLPSAKIVPLESTAEAARRASQEKNTAAIAHQRLGQICNINVLARSIADMSDNWTRFVVVGRMRPLAGNQDKTSIVFTLPDKAGALSGILVLLADENINLKKLESRPLRGQRWKYAFFMDLECDLRADAYRKLLKQMEGHCLSLRILGSYPSGPYLDGF